MQLSRKGLPVVHGPKQRHGPAWSDLHPDHVPSPFLLQLPGICKHHFLPVFDSSAADFNFHLKHASVAQTWQLFTIICPLLLGTNPCPSPSPMGLVSSEHLPHISPQDPPGLYKTVDSCFSLQSAPKLELGKRGTDRPELQ